MEIIINAKAVSFTDSYEIAIDGKAGCYSAKRKLVDFDWVIQLMEKGNERPRMAMNKISSNSIHSYDITRWDNNVLAFRPNGNNYFCQCGDDQYDIYVHKGRKYSIFKNDVQIAFWDKNAESWFSATHYKLVADNDCDFELLICFCIIADNFTKDENGGSGVFNIDLGSHGTGFKEFDLNWRPKV